MVKQLFFSVVLAALASASSASAADHVRELRQTFRSGAVLALRQLTGLGPEYDGEEVEAVIVTAAAQSGRLAQARLRVNGLGGPPPQAIDGFLNDRVFSFFGGGNRLGFDLRTLELELDGSVYVDRVVVRLRDRFDRPGAGPELVRRSIFRRVVGGEVLDVRSELGLYHRVHSGRAVREVILTVRPEVGSAMAQLLVDGRLEGPRAVIDRRQPVVSIPLAPRRNRLDVDLRRLEVQLQGRLVIEEIAVRFERGHAEPPRPGPRPDPRPVPPRPSPGHPEERLSRALSEEFLGRGFLSIDELLPELATRDGRRVLGIELRAVSDRAGGDAQLLVNGRATGLPQRITDFPETIYLAPDPHADRLGQDILALEVELRGRLRVTGVTVILGR